MALSTYRRIWDVRRNCYAKWVDRLADAHGVYVIRERAPNGAAVTLYVGESHTGRLRDTLQRHFQYWRGRTAGPTFERVTVQVAIEIHRDPERAVQRQDALILALRPIYNKQIPAPQPRPVRKDAETYSAEAFADVAGFFDAIAAGL